MSLDDKQKKTVIGWIEEGLQVSDIQDKLKDDLGVSMTYMDVRFLVDDLGVQLKDIEEPEPEKEEEEAPAPEPAPAEAAQPPSEPDAAPAEETPAPTDAPKVSVALDQIARLGAIASGKVTFSDGETASWLLDQMGRLGLEPATEGYKATEADLAEFQMQLQVELQKMGF